MKLSLLILTLSLLFTSCSKPVATVTLSKNNCIELSQLDDETQNKILAVDKRKAYESFVTGCQKIKPHNIFYKVCQKIDAQPFMQDFFEKHFDFYRWEDRETKKKGLMTGYYEPLLEGRLQKDANHTVPLLAPPADLVKIYLSSVIPELKGKVVRGRLDNGKIIPYYDRAAITSNPNPDNVICWVQDKVDLFFLQVQGSGRIQLENNQTLFVGYGDKNGHPYRSIGKYMIKHKIMSYGQMSLQGIKAWAQEHPDRIDEILNHNPSYLFFTTNQTPAKGALGVVLTPKHSIAVDTKYLPFGTPMFIQTQHPLTQEQFTTVAIAQDKGSAIKGERRIDFFWGFGEEAAQLAGHTKSRADMIIMLPKGYQVDFK